MNIDLCDICGKQMESKDIRILSIVDQENRPKISPFELCVFCAEKIKEQVEDLKK